MTSPASSYTQYIQDTSMFSQADDKAVRAQLSIINRSIQYIYASLQLKEVEEFGRIGTYEPLQNTSGCVIASGEGQYQVDFKHQTIFDNLSSAQSGATSGQYISIGNDERWYLIQQISGSNGITLHQDYPYLGSGETSGNYTLYYPVAQLPSGCETIDDPKNEFYLHSIAYIKPQEWLNYVRNVALLRTTPQYYTLMNNQVTNKFSLFFWPAPNQRKSIDFRYWRYPRTLNTTSDLVDWPDEDRWVLEAVIDMFSVQYMNFGEDTKARLAWWQVKKTMVKEALKVLLKKNWRRVNLGFVGYPQTSKDVLSRDLRRYPNDLS